jgi:hypothetical protein
MRVLIDECIDERLRNHLPGHDCQTVRYAGLTGLKNGDLLTAAASAAFDASLTLDQGVEYQQNLIDRKIAIVVLREVESSQRPPSPHPRLPHSPRLHPGRATRENREQRPVNDLWLEADFSWTESALS